MNELEILERQAVDAAIQFRWTEAVDLNKQIIAQDKHNLNAFLRLGFANLQLQKLNEAKRFYRKALKIQSNSNVAKENLERIKILQSRSAKSKKTQELNLDPNLFLEVPGKTKSVILVKLGQKNILAHINVGQEVYLKPKKRKVEVRARENEYIGSLPDDLSKRLLLFLKAKSKYQVFVKEANLNRVTVFISELSKGKKVSKYISFPQNIYAQITDIQSQEEGNEDEAEELPESDLEKLAETLTSEEKEYLPYRPEAEEEESEE
ncbi:hypothetical protein HYW87_02480 [Candidatus Roizmanbacteria bacterium]|nr:hypothetical protein [Candidatus Roizmanbacteria bacterium]